MKRKKKSLKISLILILAAIFGIAAGFFFGFARPSIGTDGIIGGGAASNGKSLGFHHSFFSRKDFFDAAFAKAALEKKADAGLAKGIVVPHHLLASELIAQAFAAAASEKTQTIVLISPNHFSNGRGQAISSLYDWQTPYGILEADKKIINDLRAGGFAEIDETPFENEHGISNLVGFAKKAFPNARIVPLIVKDALSADEGDALAGRIRDILPDDALVVASLDFSHYLPVWAADFHDAKSRAVLSGFDYQGIDSTDVDSKPALRVFLKYLDAAGARNFALLGNSNSAKILDDDRIAETTSYIAGIYSSGTGDGMKQATLLSFGDLLLDRYIKKAIDKNGPDYPFLNIKRFLAGSDLTLANLEGSFTDFRPRPLNPNNTSFTFDPKLAPMLKESGFNIVNLANNHVQDFGRAGSEQSRAYLDQAKIDHFGDFYNEGPAVVEEIRGIKIAFIGYSEFGDAAIAGTIAKIKDARSKADFVVAYAHWGIEYQTDFWIGSQEKGRQFIDAGADVVLGSHPHVIQPVEIYKGKPIFYSLGNFVFDQISTPEVIRGLAVGAVFGKDKIEYYLFPTQSRDFQVNLADGETRDIILNNIAKKSVASGDIKKQIIGGKIIINP